MIASFVSLTVLASGLWSFIRSSYILGRDGMDRGPPTRQQLSFLVSALLVIFFAAFLNKTLE